MAFGAQTFHLRRETGRLAELEPLVRAALTTQPQVRAAWHLALAEILLEQGLVEDATKLVDDLAEPDLPMMRYGLMRPIELRQLAELCARLGHRRGAEIVERHLATFEAEMIVLGTGHLCTGSVAFTRGIVVQTLGRQEEAIELLTRALEVEDRVGAKPHATRTRLWLAEALLARGADGDTERARQLLVRAATDATSMGHALAPRISELLASSV
jgi:tetratricopeptide (TPR) repeat protein